MSKATTKKTDTERIGERLEHFRRNIVNETLAQYSGTLKMDPSQLLKTEKGQMSLHTDKLLLWSKKYNGNIHWLVTGKGDPQYFPNENTMINDAKKKLKELAKILEGKA